MGDSEAIRHLVGEEGVSPSHEFAHGVTALHEACEGGYVETVSVLLALGADVNKQVHVSEFNQSYLSLAYLQPLYI